MEPKYGVVQDEAGRRPLRQTAGSAGAPERSDVALAHTRGFPNRPEHRTRSIVSLLTTSDGSASALRRAMPYQEAFMLKFLGGTIGVIFLIGLLVVIGLLALIF